MRNDLIAIVLPPGEAFAPAAAGPIGLAAHRLAAQPSAFSAVVLGAAAGTPFEGVPFRAVRPPWMLGGASARYAAGVVRALAGRVPAVIEVHNAADLAIALADRLPAPVVLVLHTDPQEMRRARSPAERLFLLGTLARVITLSATLRDRLLQGLNEAPRMPDLLAESSDLDALRGDVIAAWAAGEAAPI